MRKLKRSDFSQGFTLVELLVVMAILAILATVSLANFRTSQIKARDAERKANLRQIANALEAYMNDHASYPASGTGANLGKIMSCADGGGSCTNPTPCEWTGTLSREFCDTNNTVYMKEVASDPIGTPRFCYESDGRSFKIYAKLENENDPEKKGPYTCATVTNYNFGVSSGNTTP